MIPKKIHRIWMGSADIPDEYERFWDLWVKMHPGWDCITHDSDEVENRALFDELPSMSAKSDLLRYEILRREGGVYVDTDFEPLRPLDPLREMGLQFFAGWEDHNRVCTALIGAQAHHPAIEALVRDLPKWARRNRGKTPDIQTGPVFFTNTLRSRCDVTLMPPAVFYPVAYWDRTRIEELRPRLGDGPFALHHWGRSWMPADQRRSDDAKSRSVAIIVPQGGAIDPHRDAVWRWLRARWESQFPHARIIEGFSAPFSRAASINAAVAETNADVLVIADADSWTDPARVHEAVGAVEDYIIPWIAGYKLNERFTRRILTQDPLSVRLTRDVVTSNLDAKPHTHLSGVVVVTREAFQDVCGFDLRFAGWGFEDTAFIYALDDRAGRPLGNSGAGNSRGNASLVHLWHTPAPDAGRPTEASLAVFNEYRAMRGLPPYEAGA